MFLSRAWHGFSPCPWHSVCSHWRMRTDSGFSAGLAIGLLVVVVVVLVILATVPIGGGDDAKPLINIRF